MYLAEDKKTGKLELIKIYKDSDIPAVQKSVVRELEITLNLSHPNIATIEDVFYERDDPTRCLAYTMHLGWYGDL